MSSERAPASGPEEESRDAAHADGAARPKKRRSRGARRRARREGLEATPEPGSPGPESDPGSRDPPPGERASADSAQAGDLAETPRPGTVTEWKGFKLNPFQIEAIEAIRGGHNVLVSAPTGAGKTLVAEYAIEDAVRRGKRCIYTAPIKALSNQKYRDFRDDPRIDVGLMTGDVTIHPTGRVLIMTTEILRNSIFDNPEHLAEVEYVVFDEVHYMDDPERGSVWEESLIFAPPQIRFICLSATISNLDELGEWLAGIRGHDIVVISSTRRPVPLSHRLYTARNGVFDLAHIERVRKRELERAGRLGPAKKKHRLREGGRRDRGPRGPRGPRNNGQEMTAPPDAGPLLDDLQSRGLMPVLVFAFSRKDCERLAYANVERDLLTMDEKQRMVSFQEELLRLFQLDRGELSGEILSMARRGIGYHHAGMLPVHKELVERMFTSGLLKLLFTTETFALGINMPARAVVFYTLRKFDGLSFDYMSTRDYLQMAGRAGRQGLDDDGLVFSLLSPRDLADAPLKRLILGRAEPVESRFKLSFSSLLHIVERLGRARVHEAWEKSFDRFQHRGGSKKQQEHNRREQRRILDAHLSFLDELGYLEGDVLTPRGRLAKVINGYELQVTELLYRGVFENLPLDALAVVFTGLVFEERRRGEPGYVPARLYGNLRTQVSREVHALSMRAADFQLYSTIKPPEWGLTAVVKSWMEGKPFDEIEEMTDATPGDIVRNLRMAVQLMRQVRRAIDPSWDLGERLSECMEVVHRDVVDARRQLELG